jgi:hypothetical protein
MLLTLRIICWTEVGPEGREGREGMEGGEGEGRRKGGKKEGREGRRGSKTYKCVSITMTLGDFERRAERRVNNNNGKGSRDLWVPPSSLLVSPVLPDPSLALPYPFWSSPFLSGFKAFSTGIQKVQLQVLLLLTTSFWFHQTKMILKS